MFPSSASFCQQSINFDMVLIREHLPRISQWFSHMITLPEVRRAAVSTQFDLNRFSESRKDSAVLFHVPEWIKPPDHDEMELRQDNCVPKNYKVNLYRQI